MKKTVCLLLAIFISTVVNAHEKGQIDCKNNVSYTIDKFVTSEHGIQWIGLMSQEKVHIKIPMTKVFDCIDADIVDGANGIEDVNKISHNKISSPFLVWAAFKCFCKFNKPTLNGCETKLNNVSIFHIKSAIINLDSYDFATCKNGEARWYYVESRLTVNEGIYEESERKL